MPVDKSIPPDPLSVSMILRQFPNGIFNILNQYFGNDICRMAQEMHFSEKAIKKALYDEGSREALDLFEKLMGYFHENNISMDALLVQYTKERQR